MNIVLSFINDRTIFRVIALKLIIFLNTKYGLNKYFSQISFRHQFKPQNEGRKLRKRIDILVCCFQHFRIFRPQFFYISRGVRKLSGIMMVGDERDYRCCTHMLQSFLHKLGFCHYFHSQTTIFI